MIFLFEIEFTLFPIKITATVSATDTIECVV